MIGTLSYISLNITEHSISDVEILRVNIEKLSNDGHIDKLSESDLHYERLGRTIKDLNIVIDDKRDENKEVVGLFNRYSSGFRTLKAANLPTG